MEPDTQAWATTASPATTLDLGGGALLRAWSAADLHPMHAAVVSSLEHLKPWMPWATDAYASDPANATDYLERTINERAERTGFGYAVIEASTGAIQGSASLMGRIGPHAFEIGYWIHVEHTGQGLATRTAAALTEAGLALPSVERIEIQHDLDNQISGRVPARLGYVRLREEPADAPAPGGSGVHAIWVMERAAWPTSSGAALLEAARTD
jgi:ribosomal-protein-serine acetyltransferase